MINWTFLVLLFGTSIGPNFFDKNLIKNRFLDEIKEENLILRKISFFIGLVFLYIGIYFSEKVIDSTLYLSSTGELDNYFKYFTDIIMKSNVTLLVFNTYWKTRNKILYWIFSFYYRDKELKCRSELAKVVLKDGIWKVEEKNIQPDIANLKRISIDTYQIKEDNKSTECIAQERETSEEIKEDNKSTECVAQERETSEEIKEDNRHTYYVAQESEIPEKIEGLPKSQGYSILGVIDFSTIIGLISALCILSVFFLSDFREKIDDGIYKIEERSDKAEVSNEIEVLGDAIVYNGKVEAFDRRTQSFEHGTISIRKIKEKDIEEKKDKKEKKAIIYKKVQKDKKDKKEDNIYIVLIKKLGSEKNKG